MENKLHLGVYGVLRKKNNVLLIKKSRGPYTGLLDLPGGKLEHGENIEHALQREFLEETGLTINDIQPILNTTTTVEFTDSHGEIAMYHVGLIYSVKAKDDSSLITKMDVEDSLGANWYAVNALQSDQLSPFAKIVLK